jgi:hypothetical protein
MAEHKAWSVLNKYELNLEHRPKLEKLYDILEDIAISIGNEDLQLLREAFDSFPNSSRIILLKFIIN